MNRRSFLGCLFGLPVLGKVLPEVLHNLDLVKKETTFVLPDGTSVRLADWIDDKHYSTVSYEPISVRERRCVVLPIKIYEANLQ